VGGLQWKVFVEKKKQNKTKKKKKKPKYIIKNAQYTLRQMFTKIPRL
jgi:hypothetical protein